MLVDFCWDENIFLAGTNNAPDIYQLGGAEK
jgi:hypothetical protein